MIGLHVDCYESYNGMQPIHNYGLVVQYEPKYHLILVRTNTDTNTNVNINPDACCNNYNNTEERETTFWCHMDDCEVVPSRRESDRIRTQKTKLHIDNIYSLRNEGSYCCSTNQWRRVYVTQMSYIPINLMEDVPESAGQLCIWPAAIVMSKYLEYMHNSLNTTNNFNLIHNKTILELGAGGGLPSLVCAIALNAKTVVVTEQASCIKYLKQNIQSNVEYIPNNIFSCELPWGEVLVENRKTSTNTKTNTLDINSDPNSDSDCRDIHHLMHEMSFYSTSDINNNNNNTNTNTNTDPEKHCRFDVIIGCDVTFQPKLFDVLLFTIQHSLTRKSNNLSKPEFQFKSKPNRSSTDMNVKCDINTSFDDEGGICLLCHDSNSCPFYRNIYKILQSKVSLYSLCIEQVDLNYNVTHIDINEGIHIWRIKHID